jgi:hypothetical protein
MSVIDLGEYGAEFTADPYPYYAKLREAGPVHQVVSPYGDRVRLIVGGYAAGRRADRRPGRVQPALDPSEGPLDWLPGLLIRGVRRLPVRW